MAASNGMIKNKKPLEIIWNNHRILEESIGGRIFGHFAFDERGFDHPFRRVGSKVVSRDLAPLLSYL
jgi:hypothetical protein